MRIAIITHRFKRNEGQGRINYELARYLARMGYEIHLYAIGAEDDLKNMRSIYFHHIPVPNLPHIIENFIFMFFTVLKLSGNNYDILHITGAIIPHAYHINNCQFCHTAWKKVEDTVCYEGGIRGIYHRFFTSLNSHLEKLVYRKPGIVTAASGKIKTELIEYLGVNKERIYTVYNGVDTDEFTPVGRNESRRCILGELGLSEEDILILFMGDMRSKRKGAEFLLRAFQKIKDERIKLLLVGPRRGKYHRGIIKKLNLEDRVILTGFRRDTADIYRSSDIFVFPTLYEACSISVLEAMASGLSCVVSRETGTAEIMEDGVDGIILKNPGDVDEICEKIEFLAEHPEMRKSIGEKARLKAMQHKWEDMGRECEKLILGLK